MKKSLVSTAVLLVIMSAASDAATVYDKDGTALSIGGRVQSVLFNGHDNYAGDHDSSLVNSSRLSIAGETKVLDWVSTFAFSEWDMADGHSKKIGDHIKAREQYVGADFKEYGKILGGKAYDSAHKVMISSDIWEEVGTQAALGLHGERRNGVIRYDYDNKGIFASVTYETAADGTPLFGKYRDIESGVGAALGYTFDHVVYGPLSFKLGLSHVKGQDDTTAINDLRFDKANHYAGALSWGDPLSGLYLSTTAYKMKTDFTQENPKSDIDAKGYEFVAGYTFDNGIGVFAGYNYWKEDTEHKNGTKDTFSYKRIPVSLKYGINSNFKVWTEAEFDAGSDVKKSKLKSGTQFSAGARYTF